MNYKNIILNRLLDKYEASKSLTSKSNKRIMIKADSIKEYDIENYEIKKIFHDDIFYLENKELIYYSWKKYETGNILKEIWLNKDNIEKAYLEVGRVGIKKTNNDLKDLLENTIFKQDWLENFRKDMINYLQIKNKPNNILPIEYAKDIISVLKVIDSNEQNLKRVLSIKCFGDSKYFEKSIEHYIIRIVKNYLLDSENKEEYTNNDILLEVRNIKISRNNGILRRYRYLYEKSKNRI